MIHVNLKHQSKGDVDLKNFDINMSPFAKVGIKYKYIDQESKKVKVVRTEKNVQDWR